MLEGELIYTVKSKDQDQDQDQADNTRSKAIRPKPQCARPTLQFGSLCGQKETKALCLWQLKIIMYETKNTPKQQIVKLIQQHIGS